MSTTPTDLVANAEALVETGRKTIAGARSLAELDDAERALLGKASPLNEIREAIKSVDASDRAAVGQAMGAAREALTEALAARRRELRADERAAALVHDRLDLTLGGSGYGRGHMHPVTRIWRELEDVFVGMGYKVAEGPEVETDWYNFEALNFTPDHPARDTQDTFFLDVQPYLLRTHTSNVQIRSMERYKPPVKVLSCGRVYRRDEITMRRSPMFHQAEGFLVDRGIHIGHLRATLELFIHRIFGPELQMRMRPSFFPFTEPSAEVDMSCVFCKGAGCGTCSQTGWMEILGCGMIHPQVLRNVGIDPEEWSGFAFGLGLDRMAMIKFDIPNIRTLFENDLRVLQQF